MDTDSGSGAADRHAASACLVVLDGWGLAEASPGNAVSLAETPVFDALWRDYPHTTLTAWGRAVGLPEGQMGNSEVGHLNLGAGAVVRQDLVRIDDAIADGSLASNDVLRDALDPRARLHLIGLVSDGGVHSSLEHLRALVALARERGVSDVVVHAFSDGRDTLPHGGAGYLAAVDAMPGARVGSVIGRYWAMDRDRRWERTQRAYDLLAHGRAPFHAESGEQAVRAAYERGETDEFIEPTLVGDLAAIAPGDSVLAFNFRPDRMRQLTRALAEPRFGEELAGEAPGVEAGVGPAGAPGALEELPGWSGRGGTQPLARYATLTEYEQGWPYPVAFAPERPATTLAAVLADAGIAQLHVAETEKYPHVTYFFNGGEERELRGERRELVASPRDVPTYDHKPQMSAPEAAQAFVRAWREDRPGFAIINFANADMVGHTGVIAAAVTAIETVDRCLGEVLAAVGAAGGVCVVTADHGNADHMLEPDGSPNTAHSLNPVPLIVTAPGVTLREQDGILADVAPTVLDLLGIAQPAAMTGRTLLLRDGATR
ncbi:MAG TPA: 2,3-bisphosphoglycerate-independent phosphoglycerate mutase [Solirubrobacteraceae bacterium]|jgi:2,3-bisphosphoglycerate-independent phosphoglycerate mutase|nr:2,3-bisphosphoglycerate-independent phosphoglycerate mutase [Solirubrobacteraceae bacterium]